MGDDINTSAHGAASVFLPLFSTLGSLLFVFILLCLAYYLRFYRHGRILLGSGLPGSFDDEQQAIREEGMYLHTLDESARQAYFRAKGRSIFTCATLETHVADQLSLSRYKSSGWRKHGHLTLTIPLNTGERCLCVGVRAGPRSY